MITLKETLKVGCFYPVKGEVMKFVGWRHGADITEFMFDSWRCITHTLKTYNSAEAEEKAFSQMADWLQKRCRENGTRLCESETLEAIALCKITDVAVISDYNENKSKTDADMYLHRSRFD
jgi:hypothetical protein